MNLILLGAPGAGKGTQAARLCQELNIPTISTGNMLRAAIKEGTHVGQIAEGYMKAGKLVPDEVIMERMTGRRVCEHCGASYHLTAVPPKVEGVCDVCGGKLVQRHDDEPEVVRARLEVYHQKTEPLKDFYAERGLLRAVENRATVEEMSEAILRALGR